MRLVDAGRLLYSLAQWPIHWSESTASASTAVHPFAILEDWSVLGPFQIGTREAVWGADPLESHGGFHSLTQRNHSTVASSLPFNGTVLWSQSRADVEYLSAQEVTASLDISFPAVDWSLLQQVYGWSALQWQAWVRGSIVVTSAEPVRIWLHLTQVLEYSIDGQRFFGGDMYGFHRAPNVLTLSPGEHIIELRVVRDVRAMGGITDNPDVEVRIHISATHAALRRGSEVLLPDRLDSDLGPFSSTFASVILRNDNNTDIYIDSVEATHNVCLAHLVHKEPIKLVPGQSRPVAFQLACIPGTSSAASIKLFFHYHTDDAGSEQHSLFVWGLPRRPQPCTEPHLFTYQHPSGIVSYAILKPPILNLCDQNETLPVLALLHGAGVEADDDQVKHSMDEMPDVCAWTLFPSGVTSWSGDDWHDWGWADVRAAIQSIPAWIEQVDWTGPGVDTERWLVSGHSNGGQGTWHALLHYPDNIIAAAPVSGYTGIQTYVPYSWWRATDPGRTAIIQAALSSHRHELLLENAAGIPIMIQHGSADDNVPAYHSRLMYALSDHSSNKPTFNEVEGKPHWWDGVMTTSELSEFYLRHLGPGKKPVPDSQPADFTLVSSNPGNTGSKHGFTILDLMKPAQLGRVSFTIDADKNCQVRTLNVRSLAVSSAVASACRSSQVDGVDLSANNDYTATKDSDSGLWTAIPTTESKCRRLPTQHGGLEAILRSTGVFQIVTHSPGSDHIALQIANNLCQYFSADANVVGDYQTALKANGSIVSVAIGDDLPSTRAACNHICGVTTADNMVTVKTSHGTTHTYSKPADRARAATFLRPLPDGRLELVVWAVDVASLSLAARLVPTLTGSGQPDFVIASDRMADQGIEGVLAMGFFDHNWCASSSSFFVDGDG